MNMKFIGKTSLVFALSLAAATVTYARDPQQIPCPEIATIQQSAIKINATQLNSENNIVVYTASPAFYESNLPWSLEVLTKSKSDNDALMEGKETVKNINMISRKFAVYLGNESYICVYHPGPVVVIGGKYPTNL